jgi:uncharacterized repeat protein (TIGR01451 family)
MRRVLLGVCAVVLLVVLAGVGPAFAETAWWHVGVHSTPRSIAVGSEGHVVITVHNLGDATASGGVVIQDELPPGVTATGVYMKRTVRHPGESEGLGAVGCAVATVSCVVPVELLPYEAVEVFIAVSVGVGALPGAMNRVLVSGGGAPSALVVRPFEVGPSAAGFGVADYELTPEEEGGSLATQAGSHPFQLTTNLELEEIVGEDAFEGQYGKNNRFPAGHVKDLHFELPAGLVGNPTVTPQCSFQQFTTAEFIDDKLVDNNCPANTAVGVASVRIGYFGGERTINSPVFNLTPAVGEPARFGFTAAGVPVYLDTAVRTGGDYGVTVNVSNISQLANFIGSEVTFWGVPNDPRHDPSRGWNCLSAPLFPSHASCEAPGEQSVIPFLTLPTSCPGALESTLLADSWAEPSDVLSTRAVLQNGFGEPVGLDGCNQLNFEPSISVAPDGQAASTPTGLAVGIHVPQEETLNPVGLAQANVKNTTVTLPAGVQLSPGAADGLLSCPTGDVGLETIESASCPEASKVGTVEITTPLLPERLVGGAYLAQQDANPFGSLVALYIIVEDPKAGVLIKVAGKVSLDPVTGQIVSTFENTPQLPFSDLELHFFGSARAPLSTPPLCGTYTTQASIAPWSGNPAAEPSSNFEINSGPNGAPCSAPRPFTPGFSAGSTNVQAGEFTPFVMTLTRPDADQTLASLTLHMPEGLSGSLSKLELCPEPQASQGTCGPNSLIGETIVSAGLGGAPFTVQGGKVFITCPYKGAPFGLSILNPAKAGPFDLGYVVVRAKIEVNPTTAALTVVSDSLPTIIDGIPLQLQHVQVSINRPQFTFNATDCNPMGISASMSSTEGASATGSSSYQVTNCADLGFTPKFAVSTAGKTSRAGGASLDVKLSYPLGPKLANIAKVKVELPKQLPSRLTTLQQACLEETFNANPESCPAASRVGEAVATTPVLSGPLTGPAYFVSHGGAKFPELIIVLKGEDGVTVDLHGETYISKQGITSSTFATVPDVPVGSFELKLPQGRYSALAANGNLCKSKLVMPTEFVAQNGAKLEQDTKITATGCPKAQKAKVKHKRAKRHRARRKQTKQR